MNSNTIDVLNKLELTADEFWNISHQTGNFISILIKAANIKNVLELGTSNGYSALWTADALQYTGGHLTTVEFWEKRQKLAREYIENCGLSSYVTFKTGQAIDVINNELQNEKYDMVFMDANKNEYLSLFRAFNPLVKKGGIVLADNVISHAKKAAPFLEEILNSSEYQAQVLDLPDGLLAAYKLKDGGYE